MKKAMNNKALLAALICTSVLTGGTTAFAEESVGEFALDTMVVTATRTMKQLQEVPASVSVVTAADIEKKNITSMQEALQHLPGVYMNQSAQSGIQLRGFSSEDILILVDGMQMNTTYNGSANLNTIPVENIERIEVLRGAASSIYGGYAVGGVISITTKEAQKVGTHVDAVVSYGSNSTWKKSLQVNSKVNDKWSFGLGYENRKADGYYGAYRTAKGQAGTGTYTANLPQLANGYYVYGSQGERDWEHENYNAHIKYNFDEEKSLKYTYGKTKTTFSYANAKSYVKDAAGNPVYNGSVTTQNGDKISFTASKFYGYENWYEKDTHALTYKDEGNKLTASISYVDSKKDGFTSPSVPSSYDDIDWTGAGSYSSHPGKVINYDIEKAWENIGKHTIVVGANFKQEEMTQDRFQVSNWKNENSITGHTGQDHGKVNNLAVFIQDEYKFNDPFTMYLGLRLDHYKKGSGTFMNTDGSNNIHETSESKTYNELSPKIAFDYKADDSTNYYVSYGHSFRPPTMYKMYRYSEFTSYWYVPNPDLDPETSDTFEIGMKKKLSDSTNLGVTLYHVKTDDKIEATGLIPGESFMGKKVKKYINLSSEKRKGIEFDLTHKFSDKYSGYLNYAWQRGTKDYNGTESNQYTIPKHLLHAGIEYNYDKWNALLDCQYVSERQSPDSPTGEYGAEDAFFIVNTAINYTLSKGVVLQFGINNLFNREFYCSEATSGRTYNVGLRYSF